MDDVKRGVREVENTTKEAVRELDGQMWVTTSATPATTSARISATPATRCAARPTELGDRAEDEADRRF